MRKPGISIDDHDWSDKDKARMKALDIGDWTKRHPHDHIQKLLASLIASLREETPGLSLLGIGYCFGGKHVFRLAKRELKVAIAFHPVSLH